MHWERRKLAKKSRFAILLCFEERRRPYKPSACGRVCALSGSGLRAYTPLFGGLDPRIGRFASARAIGGLDPRYPPRGKVTPCASVPVLLPIVPGDMRAGNVFDPPVPNTGGSNNTFGQEAGRKPQVFWLPKLPNANERPEGDFICLSRGVSRSPPSVPRFSGAAGSALRRPGRRCSPTRGRCRWTEAIRNVR